MFVAGSLGHTGFAMGSFIFSMRINVVEREPSVHKVDPNHRLAVDRDKRLWSTILLVFMLVVVLRNAWVTEDAYIMFRSIDNFLNGYGLTWNISERVQTFTNPLWTLLLAGISALGGDLYQSSIFVGAIFGLGAAWLVVKKLARDTEGVLLFMAPLILSKAFMDYATSGLENPVTFLALALFHVVFLKDDGRPPGSRLFRLCLITSMALLNRMDTLLFFLPALGMEFFRLKGWRHLGRITLGLLPFILWTIFSVIYYGTPFPNTAYAKLNTGIPVAARVEQGLSYLLNSFSLDPITLFATVLAVGLVISRGSARGWALAAGVLLYLVYVVRVGGDFMSGRFVTGALFAALIGMVYYLPAWIERRHVYGIAALLLLLGLGNPLSPVFSGKDFHVQFERAVDHNGIADERGVFYHVTGFLRRNGSEVPHHWKGMALEANKHLEEQPVVIYGNIGIFGYFADPRLHILDNAALADPLLARLPSLPRMRVGHYLREVPPGYVETLEKGENHIHHPALARYYDALSTVVKGPIWSWQRFQEIYRLNTGYYDHLIQEYLQTRYLEVWPMDDLLLDRPFQQYQTGRWIHWGRDNVWGMGHQAGIAFDVAEERMDTLRMSVSSPMPEQEITVRFNSEVIHELQLVPGDTAELSLPIRIPSGRGHVEFQFSKWNNPGEKHLEWSDEPFAVHFHELGFTGK